MRIYDLVNNILRSLRAAADPTRAYTPSLRAARRISTVMLVAMAAAAGLSAETNSSWLQLPEVDISGLEPAVAEQIAAIRGKASTKIEDDASTLEEVATAVGDLGRYYHAYDFGDAAESCYRIANRLAPQEFRWPYLLGHLLQGEGRLIEAEAAYIEALYIHREVPPALMRLGQVYEARGDLDAAEAAYQEALSLDLSSAAAKASLGELYGTMGRHDQAIVLLESALGEVPEANRLYYPLALAYRARGDHDRAKALMARRGAVGVKPNDPIIDELDRLKTGERAYLLAGQRAYRAERYEEAAEAYEKAIGANSNSQAAYIGLGSALGELGRIDAALEHYESAIELAPDNVTALFNAGRLLTLIGEASRAVAYLQNAAEIAPEDVNIRLQLGDALRDAGNTRAALIQYQAARALDPSDEGARIGEAQMLASLGRTTEARDQLEAGLEAIPSSGLLAHALSRLLAMGPDPEIRDGKRALELAQKVFAASQEAAYAEVVAAALAELGRCDEATQWQRRILEVTPTGDLRAHRSSVLDTYAQGPPCPYPAQ